MYFDNCASTSEAKKVFWALARKHHPDMGGDTATMQAINAEYDSAVDRLTRKERPGKKESAYTWHMQENEVLRKKMIEIIKRLRDLGMLDRVDIEITGFWVWIHGSRPRSAGAEWAALCDALKDLGFRWGRQKSAWYFAGVPSSNRGDSWDMDRIRHSYGSQRFNPDEEQEREARREREYIGIAGDLSHEY